MVPDAHASIQFTEQPQAAHCSMTILLLQAHGAQCSVLTTNEAALKLDMYYLLHMLLLFFALICSFTLSSIRSSPVFLVGGYVQDLPWRKPDGPSDSSVLTLTSFVPFVRTSSPSFCLQIMTHNDCM
jgi:hypothetical protein